MSELGRRITALPFGYEIRFSTERDPDDGEMFLGATIMQIFEEGPDRAMVGVSADDVEALERLTIGMLKNFRP